MILSKHTHKSYVCIVVHFIVFFLKHRNSMLAFVQPPYSFDIVPFNFSSSFLKLGYVRNDRQGCSSLSRSLSKSKNVLKNGNDVL